MVDIDKKWYILIRNGIYWQEIVYIDKKWYILIRNGIYW